MENLKIVVEEYLSNHNMESKQPMPLVMFSDALVCMRALNKVESYVQLSHLLPP